MNSKNAKSLEPKILITILSFAVIPLIIFSLIGLYVAQNRNEKTAIKEIGITTQILTNSIQSYMEDRLSIIRQISQADVFEMDNYFAIDQYIHELDEASSEILNLKVYDLEGKLKAGSDRKFNNIENGKSFYEEYSFEKGLLEQVINSTQGRVFIEFQLNGTNELILITPITDDSNEKVIKILLMELSLSKYQDSFLKITENSSNRIENLLIFNADGKIVNDYNKFENELIVKSSKELFNDIKALSDNNYLENKDYYIGNSKINLNLGSDTSLTWHLVAASKKNKMALIDQAISSLGLTFIIAIISIIIISLIIKKVLTPFKNALKVLEKINEGDYNQRLDQFHSGELLLIQNSFNSLLDKINHSFTELNKSIEREKDLGVLKTNFIAMASHEFRTPLAVIKAAADVILKYKDKLSQEDIDKRMKMIKTKIKELTLMMEEVLVLSKANSNKVPFKPEELNLLTFIQDSIDEFQLSQKKQRKVVFNFQDSDYQIIADKKWIKHIVSNLISNAAKYSDQDATIEMNLMETKSEISFSIKDHGIGIPEKDLKQLFNSFYRASNVGTIQGTGLGLAIIQKGINLHKGTISVESEVGNGSTFTVRLPKNNQMSTRPSNEKVNPRMSA